MIGVGVYIYIRVYGSTLYIGLACAVPPTNTIFQLLLLPTQAGMPYTNTHKHRTSYSSVYSSFLPCDKNRKFLRFFIINIIIRYKLWLTFLVTRLQEALYEDLPVQSIKFEVYHHFWPLCHSGSQFLAPAKNSRFLR